MDYLETREALVREVRNRPKLGSRTMNLRVVRNRTMLSRFPGRGGTGRADFLPNE